MFEKFGEAIEISNVESTESCSAAVTQDILDSFKKTAESLKMIAPKADDFIYFSCPIIHAAEASAINDDGSPKLTRSGEKVSVGWDISNGTMRWTTNDPAVQAYKNANLDIFPEKELIKAYKKWVHKPLCIDHKSSSVDHVRGFIVDTYYDHLHKRVVALCALDKKNYPDLARKVVTGYSSSVSMGVGVGKAICYDCGKTAKVEADFCNHMRNKSCYGEINTELNPIELSIVVNGADPKAQIKHIIASANTLNNYIDSKLKKLGEKTFNMNFNFEDSDNTDSKNNNFSFKSNNFEDFEKEVLVKLEEMKELAKKSEEVLETSNNLESNKSDSAKADVAEAGLDDSGLAPPHERYASFDDFMKVAISIENKITQMKQSFDNLKNASITQEENMSGKNINKSAYYQGTEEPTPGKPKYTKDPLNEKVREEDDKQMVGQTPFPGVGPVDGLHPSPDSVDTKNELERKKMLARAELEQRAIRRNAIVENAKKSLAYFQNGDGANGVGSPSPGKVKYPVDKLNNETRDYEDKQMVGQKPFPGVGAVDGLHPSPASADIADELKRKELLRRADALRARFTKAANTDGTVNQGKSSWEIFKGDQLLLTASVSELSGGQTGILYDSIATKEFGSKLIEKFKAYGADGLRSLVKKAQDAAPALPVADAPVEMPVPAAVNENAPPVVDEGKNGTPQENVVDLANRVKDLSSDLAESVSQLEGEQPEMGQMDKAASFGTRSLNSMRKELNAGLVTAMNESIENLNEHEEELQMLASLYEKGAINKSNKAQAEPILEAAVAATKESIAEGFKLMAAYVRYARGTDAIMKRAEVEAEVSDDSAAADDMVDAELMDLLDREEMREELEKDENHFDALDADLDSLESDSNDAMLQVKPGEQVPTDAPKGIPVEVMHAEDSMNTKEARAQLRMKLASENVKFNPILHDAHPKGGFTTELDVKPSGDLAHVEDLEEKHSAMMDVATAPVKVRKEAAAIEKLISQGKITAKDVDSLVAEGLDAAAVAYWKKYYNQTEGGNEFASELVKEHVKAEMEEQLKGYKIKLARSYELANDMARRGLCHDDMSTITAEVDKIMQFNDESFDQLKKVVAKYDPIKKNAGKMPQVGVDKVFGSDEPSNGLYEDLSAAFSKNNKKSSF